MSDTTPVGETITLSQDSSPDAPACDITIPRELGPVRLIREIGRGGMGVVYLGRHGMLDRDVAVKFLLNAVAGTDDPGFKRFLDEGRAAAAVRHPALTIVYDADLIENVPYLVIEYVNGPTLSEVIRRSGYLSLAATLAVLDPVIHAISELHAKAIIHRDVKPSNVLLDADARVLVTDFGLACARPQAKKDSGKLRLAGTPAYMAPEMFDGHVSPQSDVYALGIMTFELLTGGLPFTGTVKELREKHLQKPLPLDPLREHGVDSALIEIVERATHKKEMFRFKRAEHFWRALRDGVATDELLASGAVELRDTVFRLRERVPVEAPTETAKDPSTSTYFEQLSELAAAKRSTTKPQDQAEGSPQEPVSSGPIAGDRPLSTATLEADVPCAKCDYNLRGLLSDGRCPECGEPIASSLRPDRLLFANPKWLSTIALGQTLIFGTMIALPILSGVAFVAIVLLRPTGVEFLMVTRLVVYVNMAIGGGVIATGVFLSTRPEAALETPKRTSVTRWIARMCALVGVPAILAGGTVSTSSGGVTSSTTTLIPFGEYLQPIGLAACVIGSVSLLLYLRKLAERVPDARLVRQSRRLATSLGAMVPLGLGCLALKVLFLSSVDPPESQLIFWLTRAVTGIPGLLLMAIVLFYWCLMVAYRRAIKRVIAVAVPFDILFGDIPTEVALTSAENKTSPISEHQQKSLQATEGTLQVDVSCTGCEYNLRGLSSDGRCPECGEGVASSLGSHRLMFAPGSWLSRGVGGLTVIIWALGIGVPLAICLIRVGIAIGQRAVIRELIDGTVTFRMPPNLFLGLGSATILTTLVAFAIGLFMATRREPQVPFAAGTDTIRRAARLLLVLFPVTFVLLQFFPLPTLPSGLQFRHELAVLLLGSAVLSFVLYLAALAARIPDSRLARRSRLIVTAVVVLLVLSVIPGMLGFVSNLVPVALVPTIVAVFVLGIWFRRAFRRVVASNATYDSLFGNVPTRAALAYAETKTTSASEPRESIVWTTSSTLVVDLPCVQCEYNLRGLPAGGRCPECSEGVTSSLQRDRLLFADPSWVGRIALGQTLVLAGSTMFWILLPFVTRSSIGSIAEIMLALSGMTMAGVIVVGVFLSTQRESARRNVLHARGARWAARSLALTWLSCWSAGIALRWSGGVEYPALVTLRVAAASGLIVCFFLCLAPLASRIPNQRLVKYSRGMAYMVCAFLLSWIARGVFLDESLSDATRIIRVTSSRTVAVWLDLSLFGSFLAAWLGMYMMGYWAVLRYRNALTRVGAATVSFDTLFGEVPDSG